MTLTKCESCEGLGAVVSNDPNGKLEIQRCDDCKFFDSDQAARKVFYNIDYTIKSQRFVFNGKKIIEKRKLIKKTQNKKFCQVRLPEEMGVA
jgi:Zn-finger protein